MVRIILIFILTLLLGGCFKTCDPSNKPPLPPTHSATTDVAVHRARLSDITENIQSNSGNIGKLGAGIVGNAERVIQENPAIKEAVSIRTDAQQILGLNADTLRHTETIKQINTTLLEAEKKIQELNDHIIKKDQQIADFQNQVLKKAKDLWIIISSFASLVFIASLCITIVYSPKIGMPLMLCSVATISVSYFMIEYMQIVAICGGVITLGILCSLLYQAYIERKALRESIVTMEVSKRKLWDDQTKKQIDEIQSATTKDIVKSEKDHLKKNGHHLMI